MKHFTTHEDHENTAGTSSNVKEILTDENGNILQIYFFTLRRTQLTL